jgi:hypothetical protein
MVKGSKKVEIVKSKNDSIESIINKAIKYLENEKEDKDVTKIGLFKGIKEIINPESVYTHSLSEDSDATENQLVYHYFRDSDLNKKTLKMLEELIEKIRLDDTYCVEFNKCTEEELITLMKFDDNTYIDHHRAKKDYINYSDLKKFYEKVQNDKEFNNKKYSSEFEDLLKEEFHNNYSEEEEEEEEDDDDSLNGENDDDKEGNEEGKGKGDADDDE